MISIDYQSKLPLYEQVARRFQTLILKGVLEPDAQMPSVRALAVELSINPNTIQKAYAMLEQQGYIYPVKGRGNFVADSTAPAACFSSSVLISKMSVQSVCIISFIRVTGIVKHFLFPAY